VVCKTLCTKFSNRDRRIGRAWRDTRVRCLEEVCRSGRGGGFAIAFFPFAMEQLGSIFAVYACVLRGGFLF